MTTLKYIFSTGIPQFTLGGMLLGIGLMGLRLGDGGLTPILNLALAAFNFTYGSINATQFRRSQCQ